MDPEYYQPIYLEYERTCRTGDALGNLTHEIIHPVEIVREYSEEGIRILLAQNIRSNFLDLSHEAFMPPDCRTVLTRNLLLPGDVVMTRSGANFGDAACYFGEPKEIYACADCLIIRPQGIPTGFLATFFNTDIGRALLTRGAYGAAQPHIAPPYLKSLRLPRLGNLEQKVHDLVLRAESRRKEARKLYQEAETILCASLGLANLDLSPSIFYERPYHEVAAASRADAEYYQPKYLGLMKALKATRPEKIVPLGEYLSFLTNGHTPLHHDLSEGEVPFLTAEHVFDFRVTYDSDKRIERIHHEGELKRTQLREGDFLITIKGRIGNAAVVEDLPVPTNINQDVALLRLKDGLPPYYLLAYLNSIVGKAFSEQYCTGQINPFLGLGNLRLLPIPIYDHQRMTDLADETAKVIGEARKAGEESKGLLAGAKMIVEQAVGGVGKRLHYRNGES
jgi:hypothetical protein